MANGFRVIEGGRGSGCGFLSDAEIDAYCSGSLGDDQLEAFAAHRLSGCRPCALFGADLQAYREVIEGGALESERRHFDQTAPAQRAVFDELLAEPIPARTSRRFPNWALGLAAMIAIAGFFGVQFFGPGPASPAIDLPDGARFAYQAPVAPSLVRDGGAFARGRSAFAAGDHAAAAAAFEAVEIEDPRHADALFFAGVSRLIEGRSDAATVLLERALALYEQQSFPLDEARYYLALASIDRGRTDFARELLESIEPGSQLPAAELLEALR